MLFLREHLRRDFSAFVRKAWPHISGGDEIAWNWHIDAMAYRLGRIKDGQCRRHLVTIPPRNGKSKIISVIWVAWMLGQDPTTNFVGVSYSLELSAKMARDCLSIMQSAWYRELFPKTIISAKRSATADFETTAGGGRLSTSITGTLTGRGGDIIILDDLIKPEDARSDTVRENVNDWYRSTLLSRLNDKASGVVICVMQRLHQYDLPGLLIERGDWDHLKLPAIAVEDEKIPLTRGRVYHRKTGEVLHPERESREVLEEQKSGMGSIMFAAQYQQDPVPETGNIIRAEWFKVYLGASLDRSWGRIVQSWDTASKDNPHNDYSVCTTALVRGRDTFIIDVFRKRMQMPELKRMAIELARRFSADVLLIEDQASGQQLIQLLNAENTQGVPSPIPRRPEGDKEARAIGISAMVEAGQLFLPGDAPWLADFKAEILGFPSTRYDDQMDSLSQLLGWVQLQYTYQPPPNAGPILMIAHDDGSVEWEGEGSEMFDGPDYEDDPWAAY